MLFMQFVTLGVDQDVINENNDKLVQKVQEHFVHHIHEVSWCIGQPKRHHCILIRAISSDKCGLEYVQLSNLHLEIPGSNIDL